MIPLIVLLALLFGCRTDDTARPTTTETTTITLAASANFQAAYEQLIAQAQQDHPQIQIQFVPLSAEQGSSGIGKQAALADILLLEGTTPPTETSAAFLNLEPLMAADANFDAADFWPGLMGACQAAGVQVGLPFRANASLLFFDKSAFDAAGLPYPVPGWSWETFRQTVQALAVHEGEQTRRYGFADGGAPLALLAPLLDNLIMQSGDTLDGQRLAAELDWYVTLANEEVILSESGNVPDERQAAMWVGSQFNLGRWQTVLSDDLGVAPFPATAESEANNPVSAGCALISAGTTHSQAAWTFLHYLSRQALFASGVYPAAPARPLVAESSGYWDGMEPQTAAALRAALEQGWYRRADMPQLSALGEALSAALAGESALADSLPGVVEVQSTTPPPAPDSDPVAVATARATPTLGRGVAVIEYDAMPHDNREAIIALARTFNESQDRVHVNATTIPLMPQGGTLVELAAKTDCFLSGMRPDTAFSQLGDSFLDAYFSLSPLFDAEEAAFRNDFALFPEHLQSSSIDGELYALPVAVYPTVLRYHADLLAGLGIAAPAANWTVEEFWALIQAAGGGNAYGLIPASGILPDELLSFVPGAAYYFDLDSRPARPRFSDPAVRGALEFLGRMVEQGILYPHTEWASRRTAMEDLDVRAQALGVVNGGGAAVWGHQVGTGAGMESRVPFGVVPFPQRTLPNLGGNEGSGRLMMLYISKRSPDPSACWEWFKYLTAQPDTFLGIPIRQSVRESAVWRDTVGVETAEAYETMYSRLQDLPPDLGWETFVYRTWWADALHSVYRGEDPSLALAEAQRRAESFYDCYAPLAEQALPEFPPFALVQACARQADPDFRR